MNHFEQVIPDRSIGIAFQTTHQAIAQMRDEARKRYRCLVERRTPALLDKAHSMQHHFSKVARIITVAQTAEGIHKMNGEKCRFHTRQFNAGFIANKCSGALARVIFTWVELFNFPGERVIDCDSFSDPLRGEFNMIGKNRNQRGRQLFTEVPLRLVDNSFGKAKQIEWNSLNQLGIASFILISLQNKSLLNKGLVHLITWISLKTQALAHNNHP